MKTKDFISRKQKKSLKTPSPPRTFIFKKCEGVVEQSKIHDGPTAPGNLARSGRRTGGRCGGQEWACAVSRGWHWAGDSRNQFPAHAHARAPGQSCHPITGRQFGKRSEKWVHWPHIPRKFSHNHNKTSGLSSLPLIILPDWLSCKGFKQGNGGTSHPLLYQRSHSLELDGNWPLGCTCPGDLMVSSHLIAAAYSFIPA